MAMLLREDAWGHRHRHVQLHVPVCVHDHVCVRVHVQWEAWRGRRATEARGAAAVPAPASLESHGPGLPVSEPHTAAQ